MSGDILPYWLTYPCICRCCSVNFISSPCLTLPQSLMDMNLLRDFQEEPLDGLAWVL
jgi:hypothetical protein